jgi:hypothetical protein
MPTREELVLAALAPAKGIPFTPVQVQKLLFLIDRNIADKVDGPHFDFQPYNYGPFDKAVYDELERQTALGNVELVPEPTWNDFRLTAQGQARGEAILAALPPNARSYIERAVGFVQSLSFTELVSAIYREYPDMRVNSVFQD